MRFYTSLILNILLTSAIILCFGASPVLASCSAPANPIEAENCKPGNNPSEWDIVGDGDPGIQGFATDISVNKGQTVQFKIKTSATHYKLDIYRIGFYAGQGARKIVTVSPSAPLPQIQPTCLTDPSTLLFDCGNWQVSAAWQIPADSVSGVYIAKVINTDTNAASHIIFVVRDDSSHSDLLLQTSDTTWQAYNAYGGNSLYTGAKKVSYNRPFNIRASDKSYWFFAAEYAMVRFVEANGYDVSYFTGVDSDRFGSLIKNHKAFLSVGHDEYWSKNQRTNVESARNSGINLAFFSGNEIFWKTRWENSIDPSNTSYRTLVSYKETHANAKVDPLANIWTGTWRDARFSPPADGGYPENALSGTSFIANGTSNHAITVSAAFAKLRFWRNTPIASLTGSQSITFPVGTLGYEWDTVLDNGFSPAGLVKLSQTTVDISPRMLLDNGSTYGNGTATHNLVFYKHQSGALVFGAGTINWAYGLDSQHESTTSTPPGSIPTNINMRQAMINLFADMGIMGTTIQADLVQTTKSTDTATPKSVILTPAAQASLEIRKPVNISGTASDMSGQVGGVEVSTDGGISWHLATGTTNWSYQWTPTTAGTALIQSRAVDDSGNQETNITSRSVQIIQQACPCSLWTNATTPQVLAQQDAASVEIGVKFQSDINGSISGLKFYKGAQNTGPHVASLWSANGQLLARATFVNETASGWQHVAFSSPVAIAAKTTYVASYHTNTGYYSVTRPYFTTEITNPPLRALSSSTNGGNGLYMYGNSAFPTNTFESSNYWVDVIFNTSSNTPTPTPAAQIYTIWNGSAVPAVPSSGDLNQAEIGLKFKSSNSGKILGIRFYKGSGNTGPHVGHLWNQAGQLLATVQFTNESASGWQQANFSTPINITANTVYTASYNSTKGYAYTRNFFLNKSVTTGPLKALADGESGGNGVYLYGTGGFPNNSYQSSNYWVDVVYGQ